MDSKSGVVTAMGPSITWHDILNFLDSVEYVEDKIRFAVYLLKPVEYRPESSIGLGVVRAWMAFTSLLETMRQKLHYQEEHRHGWSEHQQSP